VQRELFSDFRRTDAEKKESFPSSSPNETSFLERVRITLTLEKILLLVLTNLIAFVLVYSVGFQRGRGPAAGLFPELGLKPALLSVWTYLAKPFYAKAEQARPAETKPQTVGALTAQNLQDVPADPAEEAAQQETIQAVAEGLYTIQLVTYRNESRAEKEVKTLSEKGHSPFIIPSGKFYQVCIDRFPAKDQACKKLSEFKTGTLAQIYRGAYIRPIKR